MEKIGFPFEDAVSKVAPKPMPLDQVRAWREKEAAAGRPSSYKEYCRTHGLCVTCLGEGITHNDDGIGFKVIGIEGDTRLYERCPVCGGTGQT